MHLRANSREPVDYNKRNTIGPLLVHAQTLKQADHLIHTRTNGESYTFVFLYERTASAINEPCFDMVRVVDHPARRWPDSDAACETVSLHGPF